MVYAAPPNATAKLVKSADGTQIYADAVGDPSKPALVFVPGFTFSTIVFDDLFQDERLSDEFYLVRYDPRGNGRSDHPPGELQTLKGHAQDFAAVKATFHLVAPILVGWSAGAVAASDVCAVLPPDAISGLIFLSGSPLLDPVLLAKLGSKRILEIAGGVLQSADTKLLQSSMIEMCDLLWADVEKVPYAVRMAWLGVTFLQTPEVRLQTLVRATDPEGLYAAGKRGLPLLVINSDRDKHRATPDGIYQELKPYFRDIEYKEIKGGGHAFFYEKQDETVDAILPFARRVVKSHELRE